MRLLSGLGLNTNGLYLNKIKFNIYPFLSTQKNYHEVNAFLFHMAGKRYYNKSCNIIAENNQLDVKIIICSTIM